MPETTVPRQFALVGAAVFAYFAVRGQTEAGVALAARHGEAVLHLERTLHVAVEARLQGAALEHRWFVTTANWVYIWGHWPVIVGTLVHLYRNDRRSYLLLRNAMFVSGAIGLLIFARYPVMPPRLLGAGISDTVTGLSHSYRVLQPPALVNKYAAVPSLHVGWNFLVGVVLARSARGRVASWAAALSPALMIAAVVLTGNHYVFDAAAGLAVAAIGAAVAAIGGAVAWWWSAHRARSDAARPTLRLVTLDDAAARFDAQPVAVARALPRTSRH